MNELRYGVGGTFTLERRRASDESLIESSGPCKNLVVGTGLDMLMGRYGGGFLYGLNVACAVGEGNAIPTLADTALQNYLGGTTRQQGQISNTVQATNPPFYSRKVFRWRFNPGEAVGNVAEIAVLILPTGSPTPSTPIYSRALVRNQAGDPTVISVQDDEFLDIIYTHDLYCPADASGTCMFNLAGTASEHAYILRGSILENNAWQDSINMSIGTLVPGADPSYFTSAAYNGDINASVTGNPSGSRSPADSSIYQNYVNGSYQRAVSIVFGLNYANFNIRSILYHSNMMRMQIQYDPVIPKTGEYKMQFDYIISVENFAG